MLETRGWGGLGRRSGSMWHAAGSMWPSPLRPPLCLSRHLPIHPSILLSLSSAPPPPSPLSPRASSPSPAPVARTRAARARAYLTGGLIRCGPHRISDLLALLLPSNCPRNSSRRPQQRQEAAADESGTGKQQQRRRGRSKQQQQRRGRSKQQQQRPKPWSRAQPAPQGCARHAPSLLPPASYLHHHTTTPKVGRGVGPGRQHVGATRRRIQWGTLARRRIRFTWGTGLDSDRHHRNPPGGTAPQLLESIGRRLRGACHHPHASPPTCLT